MTGLRRYVFDRVPEGDPRAACARPDCGRPDVGHGRDPSGPSHNYRPPSLIRFAARSGYRWLTARRRLREELEAAWRRNDELSETLKRYKTAADTEP